MTRYWVGVPVALLAVFGLLKMMSGGDEKPASQATVAAVAKRAPVKPPKQDGPVESELQSELRGLLEECDFFQERVVLTIPKSFVVRDASAILAASPGLLAAERMPLFTYDPPFSLNYATRTRSSYSGNEFINVTLTDRGSSTSGVSETSSEYRFDLGYRQLLSVVPNREVDGKITARWYWTVENRDLLELATARADRFAEQGQAVGYLEAQRSVNGWVEVKIKRAKDDDQTICEW